MHIHILGICGTFMGGLAIIARQLGHRVTGSDASVYPPMSTQLEEQGIELMQGYRAKHLDPPPDLVIVGNAMSRGNEAVEYMLNQGLRYTSGPQWLSENVLVERTVLAVAGTHGKTTTSSLLAWILEFTGRQPGFLIGGVPQNFGVSARLGDGPLFVIEADEYDSAFFDKRSKFVHYRPRYLALNNLEFDHADIFDDLNAIKRQFHHLVRTVPANGTICVNADDVHLEQVLQMGCWTPIKRFGIRCDADFCARPLNDDWSQFDVIHTAQTAGTVSWSLPGEHNMANALAATALAVSAGVDPQDAVKALAHFQPPKRRLELKAARGGILVYDDFAHHPTAITLTLAALRRKHPDRRLVAVFEPRSNTMKRGVHHRELGDALKCAELSFVLMPSTAEWQLAPAPGLTTADTVDALFDRLAEMLEAGDCVCVMSNGAFGGITERLADHVGR